MSDSNFSFGRIKTLSVRRMKTGRGQIPHVLIGGIEHKSCGTCGSLKKLEEFHNDQSRLDGKYPTCNDCRNK